MRKRNTQRDKQTDSEVEKSKIESEGVGKFLTMDINYYVESILN